MPASCCPPCSNNICLRIFLWLFLYLSISFYLYLPSSKELLGGFGRCPPPVALPVQIISAYEITLVVFVFLYFVFAVFE